MKTRIRFMTFILVLISLFSMFANQVSFAYAASYSALSNITPNKYCKAFMLNTTGTTIPYRDAKLTERGTITYGKSKTAYIDNASDEIWILQVDTGNGKWAKVSYPCGNKRAEAYVALSAISSTNASGIAKTSTGKFYCASRYGYSTSSKFYVSKGETTYLISTKGNEYQILYPNNTGWRLGVCSKSDYERYCSKTSETTKTHSVPVFEVGEYYYIASAIDNNQVLDVKNGSKSNGANIQLYKRNGSNAQLFKFVESKTAGYYYIVNKGSGKVIDVAGGATASSTNVQQHERNNTQAQKWKVCGAYSSSSNIRLKAYCGKYIDACGGEVKNGTNIWIYDENKTKAQEFKLIPYVNTTYKTYKLEFNDIQSWQKALELAERKAVFGGTYQLKMDGKTHYTGAVITGITAVSWRTLRVKVPLVGPGDYYEWKDVTFPSEIRFKLHEHSEDMRVTFDFTTLRCIQSCTCGYYIECSWEVPWPDLNDNLAQNTQNTVDAIRPVLIQYWTVAN